MAIEYEYTPVEALGKLAQMAGKAEAAQREAQRTQQMQIIQIQAGQQQQRLEFQADLAMEVERRSQLWELEKMDIRSRSEFALQEKQWLQREEEKQAKLKKLDEARQQGYITDDEYKRIWSEIEMGVRLPTPKKEDSIEQYMRNILGGVPAATPTEIPGAEQLTRLSSLYARKATGVKPTETVSKAAEAKGRAATEPPPFWLGRAGANVPRSELEYVEKPEPMYAVNPQTGERLISYDNGKTWEKVL